MKWPNTKGVKELIELLFVIVMIYTNIRSDQRATRAELRAAGAESKTQVTEEKIKKIETTPRLTAQIIGQSYVGKVEGRVDDVVKVPMIVLNNSDAYAYNVVLDLVFADGTGREVSLNDYFISVNAPIMKMDRLSPRGQWMLPPLIPSVMPNAKEIYASGSKKFKAKLLLTWEDDKGNKYKFVNLEELKYVNIKDEATVEGFWFKSQGAYNSIDNKPEVDKYWGMNFDF